MLGSPGLYLELLDETEERRPGGKGSKMDCVLLGERGDRVDKQCMLGDKDGQDMHGSAKSRSAGKHLLTI